MRVLVAPDSFTGTLAAAEAAAAIATGWLRERSSDELDLLPLSDGGPGFASVMAEALAARVLTVDVSGPRGARVPAHIVRHGDTAYVESAECCGLHLLAPTERDARVTTTAGVGEAIAAALDDGATQVTVGLGGTSTTDGGAGALAALGARGWDAAGRRVDLTGGGAGLRALYRVEMGPVEERLRGIRLVAASDVSAVLLGPAGAARGFAPQKGANAEAVEELDRALGHFAALLGTGPDGIDTASLPGAGAAGGLGFALLRVGALFVPGIKVVSEAVDLGGRMAACQLVITGEGALDWQTGQGKVVAGVAEMARGAGRPVAVVAGRVHLSPSQLGYWGVAAVVAAIADGEPLPRDAGASVADAAARLAAGWSRE